MEVAEAAPAYRVGPGLLESLWRRRFLVALFVIAGGTIGYLYAAQKQPVYVATAQILLSDLQDIGRLGGLERAEVDPDRRVLNEVALIRTGVVYPRTSELLDGRLSAEELEGQVVAEASAEDVNVIDVTATDTSAAGSAEIANAVVQAYEDVVTERVAQQTEAAIAGLRERNAQLREEVAAQASQPAPPTGATPAEPDPAFLAQRSAALEQLIANENRIEQLRVDMALFGSGIEAVAAATPPLAPVSPQPLRTAALGALLGLVLGGSLAWWRNSATQVAEHSQDVAAVLEAPLLGEIPQFSKVGASGDLPAATAPMSAIAEAYQFVLASLTLALEDGLANIILVTSANAGEGKTVTTLNLGVASRREQQKVLLVDADRRMRGLTSILEAEEDARKVRRAARAPKTNGFQRLLDDGWLKLLSVGGEAADQPGYFQTPSFHQTLTAYRSDRDLVLVDSPPLLAVAETSAIASHVDGIVLVVARGTSIRTLVEARNRLQFVGKPLLGYVFNRAVPQSSVFGYVRHSYAYGDDRRSRRARRQRASRSERASGTSGTVVTSGSRVDDWAGNINLLPPQRRD